MSDPGPLLARGRACDVYALDETRVLRRYRKTPYTSTKTEAEIMERVRADGYPVPAVHEVTETDLVMERVEGPTMAEEMTRHPWQLRKQAHALASLHHRLHDIPAPESVPAPLGDGPVIVHLDLHPLNVILGRDGPVVIDWSNAGRGEGDADVALTYLMLMSANPDEGLLFKLLTKFGRSLFARPFLARFIRKDVMDHLDAVAAYKLADPNMTEAEQQAIRRLVATAGR